MGFQSDAVPGPVEEMRAEPASLIGPRAAASIASALTPGLTAAQAASCASRSTW